MKTGLIASAFDPFPHVGMLWAIKQAIDANALDWIIAAVHINPHLERPQKRTPTTPLEHRLWMVRSLKWVSDAFTYNTEAELSAVIARCRPSILIVGEDHRHDHVTGSEHGIPVFYAKRNPEWSGTTFLESLRQHAT